jgi:hypothetical protein
MRTPGACETRAVRCAQLAGTPGTRDPCARPASMRGTESRGGAFGASAVVRASGPQVTGRPRGRTRWAWGRVERVQARPEDRRVGLQVEPMGAKPLRSRLRPSGLRLLHGILLALMVLQPAVGAVPTCAVSARLAGEGACCCAAPVSETLDSCCTRPDAGPGESGRSIATTSPCVCGPLAPAPAAEPRIEADSRAGGGAIERWIHRSALQFVPFGCCSSLSPPRGDVSLSPSPSEYRGASARSRVSGELRERLAVLCVARC